MEDFMPENMLDIDDEDMTPFTAEELIAIDARFDYWSSLITKKLLLEMGYNKDCTVQMASDAEDGCVTIIISDVSGKTQNTYYMEWDFTYADSSNSNIQPLTFSLYSISEETIKKELVKEGEMSIETSDSEELSYIAEYTESMKLTRPDLYAGYEEEAHFLNTGEL